MFNVLRGGSRLSALSYHLARARFASTSTFVPPESLNDVDDLPPPPARTRAGKAKPGSPTFYTARPAYYDELIALEEAVQATRGVLKQLQLTPLPRFARKYLPPMQPVWKDKRSLGDTMGTTLSTARYRRFISTLNALEHYKRIAAVAGVGELHAKLTELVSGFERENKEAVLARGKRKPVAFDEYGRTYTVGRRKESSARVWVIRVQQPSTPVQKVKASEKPKNPELAPFLPLPASTKPAADRVVPTTSILINNTPLNEYFQSITDRERVIRPLKVAGVLGAFNVFAIARGGGTAGQSGAVSLGIAKAIAAHIPEVEPFLKKAKLLRRDPRMVERKKTNLVKARAARQWVKR